MIVHEAENLPIADLTQSDPYVVITHSDKVFLRTHTIYRNHTNPSWGKQVSQSLLSLADELKVEVFDENKSNNDKLLGTVIINLKELAYAEECEDNHLLLTPDGRPAGTIHLSIIKYKFKEFIQITDIVTNSTTTTDSNKNNTNDNNNSSNSNQSVVHYQKWLDHINTSNTLEKPMKNTLIQSLLLTTPIPLGIIYHSLLPDILADAQLQSSGTADLDTVDRHIRTSYGSSSSTTLNINNKYICTSSPPIKRLGIHFITEDSRGGFTMLVIPNRHILWQWTKWLRVAFAYWKGEVAETDLPVCMCLYIYIHMYVYMYVYRHIYMHLCMYVCMYLCMYVCMYLCMYVCMYIGMCVCMNEYNIHIYIYIIAIIY